MSTELLPRLVSTETSKQLVVNGKPFLMRAGELQNSSMTSGEFMDGVWQNMVNTNVNTLLGCVTWEMIEPTEGNFNFTELDKAILGARKHGLHLVLLWFGSFKNGLSTYVPAWVKTNARRFPRAKVRSEGGGLATGDVVSLFYPEARQADIQAFGKLMQHVREIDEGHWTVLMVQVENETGLIGDSRDRTEAADQRFSEPVPEDLIDFLSKDYDNLHEDLKPQLKFFRSEGLKAENTSWEAVFGAGSKTDEMFMAYHYSHYLNDVAAAGKAAYPLPLYTNVWQNYNGGDSNNDFPAIVGGGDLPGVYPSGGGITDVLDIWQKFAPNLDLIAPDVYLNDYDSSCARYRHRNQPLFIPEQRRDEYGVRRIWIAYGSYAALGASPFGIDTLAAETNPFTKHYRLLKSVSSIVLEAQRRPNSSVGFCFDELNEDGSDPSHPVTRLWGGYEFTIERCFVYGKAGPGAGMVIHRGGGVLLLVGWGFQVRARALSDKATFTGILRFEEKVVQDEASGTLRTLRILNGDETRSGAQAMMPNEDPDYGGFPICVTIPANTCIAELEVYHLEQ